MTSHIFLSRVLKADQQSVQEPHLEQNYKIIEYTFMFGTSQYPLPLKNLREGAPSFTKTPPRNQDPLWQIENVALTNLHEQEQFLKIVQWRKFTSMPIVKVRSVKMSKEQVFPKTCCLEVEKVEKTFDKIKHISLSSALYLLRESLLAYQAITTKFDYYNLQESICGINKKGECRIWPTHNLALSPNTKGSPPSPSFVASFTFAKIMPMIKFSERHLFGELGAKLQDCLNYSMLITKIRQFALSSNVIIAESLKIEKANWPLLQTPSKKQANKSLTKYTDSNKRISKNGSSLKKRKGNSIWKHNPRIDTPFPKKNLKQSLEDLISNTTKNSSSKANTTNQSSKTFSEREDTEIRVDQFKLSAEKGGLPTFGHNIKSTQSIPEMDHFKDHKKHFVSLDHLKPYKEYSSIVIEQSVPQQKVTESFKKYDFGGLIPVPEIEIVTFNNNESNNIGNGLQDAISCQRSIEVLQKEGIWDQRLITFFGQDDKNVKESVHYETEESYPPFFEIKLQKLGKLGREVARSFVPDHLD